MAMAPVSSDTSSFVGRLATFEQPQQLTKRRASCNTTKRKAGNTVEWPHAHPSKEALARAGFFYRPASDSDDNVQCFHCSVKLDGWEETDDPISEHLAHSNYCAWATAISVTRDEDSTQTAETRDPMGEELYTARKQTFTTGEGWPHESKKGWKCKVAKLVEAGWCWDPSPDGDEPDGVTCFYCNLSLDGWEPKDDPFVEHKRREPQCPFFALVEHYHGTAEPMKKTKAKGKSRGSTASKASRVSTQSAMTAASDAQSLRDSLGDIPPNSSLAQVDDSIMTAGTTASTATTTKGKKKTTKAKAPAKGGRGKKKAAKEEEAVELHDLDLEQGQLPAEELATSQPTTKPRGTGRASKQTVVDSSVIEVSSLDAVPTKKATRAKKPKVQPQAEPAVEQEPDEVPQTPDADAIEKARLREVSAQLQEELDQSVDNFGEDLDQSTPIVPEHPKPKRGTKRMSDGMRKQQDSSSLLDMDPPSKPEPEPKAKRGRKAKQASTASTEATVETGTDATDVLVTEDRIELDLPAASQDAEADDENSQPIKKKATAKKSKAKPKGKKGSSVRSSKTSAVTSGPENTELEAEPEEDLARDELEIEQELERIATEQASQGALAIQAEQELVNEYEPSPSQGRRSKDNAEMQQLRDEVAAEAEKAFSPDRVSLLRQSSRMPGGFTPSPSGSDKENVPSSVAQPLTAQKAPQLFLSPSKTTRIPLAPGTPNRSPLKTKNVSPSKQVSGLQSSVPWTAVDLDMVFLPSPQPSPGRVGEQLVAAAGALTSPEKKMSVEEWVRYRAQQGEVELKRKCERMVETFEKQGMRAMESLQGINIVG
ncbi:Protein bir1 [Cercospora beticola]|uniref:Protein bir1 n=1 Tax=Cercospora beticola TaxID=122368 RepID=A0A2G5H9U5_CERBT|nr:Protein bir1 [Cercospora beticola]PIA89304.1 Protein bir1 [Cercospora beticola]WPB03716.1 hypothetical protein RHO25_008360 [Cercospora beticola]CAK1357524.1 unnamed protein product [Cercospora beticola]